MEFPQAASVPGRLLKTTLFVPFLAAALGQGVVVDHWTNENGLPVSSIRGICQGPEGYLWLATYDGLVRFDGVRFVPFNKSNSEGIVSDRFSWLACGHDGGFWAPTEGEGLTHYSKGRFRTYTERDCRSKAPRRNPRRVRGHGSRAIHPVPSTLLSCRSPHTTIRPYLPPTSLHPGIR